MRRLYHRRRPAIALLRTRSQALGAGLAAVVALIYSLVFGRFRRGTLAFGLRSGALFR